MRRLHRKSCVLDSFAYITGLSHETLIEDIGTDGAEEGFSSQAVVDALLKHGYAVVTIEKNPQRKNPDTNEVDYVFPLKRAVNRWKDHLTTSRGVLYGYSKSAPWRRHAVPWDGLDNGLVGCDPSDFEPLVLWKVVRIDPS